MISRVRNAIDEDITKAILKAGANQEFSKKSEHYQAVSTSGSDISAGEMEEDREAADEDEEMFKI